MKRLFFAVGLLLLLAGAAFLFFPQTEHTTPTSANQAAVNHTFPPISAPAGAVSNIASSTLSAPAKQADPAARAGQYVPNGGASTPTNLPPEIVLQNVGRAIHQYGQMFGGNPVGTNPEITAELSGKNPKQINFLSDQPGVRIDPDGQMIDNWGTPYFFHQLSASVMEIHSAGPDKIMWTSDDLVTRTQ